MEFDDIELDFDFDDEIMRDMLDNTDPLMVLINRQCMLEEKLLHELPDEFRLLFDRYLRVRGAVELMSEQREFESGMEVGAKLMLFDPEHDED